MITGLAGFVHVGRECGVNHAVGDVFGDVFGGVIRPGLVLLARVGVV